MNRFKIAGLTGDNYSEIDRQEREKRASELLAIIFKSIIPIFFIYLIVREIYDPGVVLSDIILYLLIAALIISYLFLRRNMFYLSAITVVVLAFSGMTFIAFTNYGVRDIGVITYFILIFFSALLLGWQYSVVIAVLSILALTGMTIYENMGLLTYTITPVGSLARDLSFFIVATLVLTMLYDRVLNRYINEINLSRSEYLKINEELTLRNREIMKINDELVGAKERAEQSDRLKSSFLANLSHEIRTPMNGIIGFSEIVLTREISDEEKNEYNNIISQSCKQLLGIVNDIIDISKIESGIIELNKQPVNLNRLMEEVHSLHHHSVRKNDVLFELYTGLEEERSYILTDDVKLRQILSNLISNAFKFTEKGSVRFGYTVKERFLEFFVFDTGIGISEERQNRIYERFSQEDESNSRKYGGTGLGLSIAKAYVEKLGGRIWVQSREDLGSKFFFTIPYESIQLKEKQRY